LSHFPVALAESAFEFIETVDFTQEFDQLHFGLGDLSVQDFHVATDICDVGAHSAIGFLDVE